MLRFSLGERWRRKTAGRDRQVQPRSDCVAHGRSLTSAETRAARSNMRSPPADAGGDPFRRQVGDGRARRAKSQWIDDPPRRDSTPRACADPKLRSPASMWATGMPSLAAAKSPGQGRVGVAVDDDRLRRGGLQQRLEGDEHPAGLVPVAAATDSEGVGPAAPGELTEEVARHWRRRSAGPSPRRSPRGGGGSTGCARGLDDCGRVPTTCGVAPSAPATRWWRLAPRGGLNPDPK